MRVVQFVKAKYGCLATLGFYNEKRLGKGLVTASYI